MELRGLGECSEHPSAGYYGGRAPYKKILGSKMPLDWLKIGLNLAEKIMLLSLRIPLES